MSPSLHTVAAVPPIGPIVPFKDNPARDGFRTFTGRLVRLITPSARDVSLEDVARHLSKIQRFGGATHSDHYSVAEHSVLVSYLCRPRNAFLGLFHDSAEAYLGDVVTPLKRALPDYKAIETSWMSAIGEALGCGDRLTHPPIDIKIADSIAFQMERRYLFSDGRFDPEGPEIPESRGVYRLRGLGPKAAYRLFMERLGELTGPALVA